MLVFTNPENGGSITKALSWLPSTIWYRTREFAPWSASVADTCKKWIWSDCWNKYVTDHEGP
jgi:hypothetical protein